MRVFYLVELKRLKNYIAQYPVKTLIGIVFIAGMLIILLMPIKAEQPDLQTNIPGSFYKGISYIYVIFYCSLALCNRSKGYQYWGTYRQLLIICPDKAKWIYLINYISRRGKQVLGISILIGITLFFEKETKDLLFYIDTVLAFTCLFAIMLFFRLLCNDIMVKRKVILSAVLTLYSVLQLMNHIFAIFDKPLVIDPLDFINQYFSSFMNTNDAQLSLMNRIIAPAITFLLVWFYYKRINIYAYEMKRDTIKMSKRHNRSTFQTIQSRLEWMNGETRMIVAKELAQIWHEKVPLLNALIYPFVVAIIMLVASSSINEAFYLGYILTAAYFAFMISLNSLPRESLGLWVLKICEYRAHKLVLNKMLTCCVIGWINTIFVFAIYYMIGMLFYTMDIEGIFHLLLWNMVFTIPISSAYGFIVSIFVSFKTLVKKGERNYSFGGIDGILLLAIIYLVAVPGYISSDLVSKEYLIKGIALVYEILVISIMFFLLKKKIMSMEKR